MLLYSNGCARASLITRLFYCVISPDIYVKYLWRAWMLAILAAYWSILLKAPCDTSAKESTFLRQQKPT